MRIHPRHTLTKEHSDLLWAALERSPLFGCGSQRQWIAQFIEQAFEQITYCSVSESVFGQSDGDPPGLYIVLDGTVEVFRSFPRRGARKRLRKVTVGLYGVGDVIGEIGLLCSSHTRTAEVMPFQGITSGQCAVALFRREEVIAFLKEHSECCFNLLTEEARRLQRASDFLLLDVKARLLHTLLHVAEAQYGHHDFLRTHGTSVTVRCSQRMLADLVGCSREWINHHLSEMARDGRHLHTSLDTIVIDDPATFFSGLRYNVPRGG